MAHTKFLWQCGKSSLHMKTHEYFKQTKKWIFAKKVDNIDPV